MTLFFGVEEAATVIFSGGRKIVEVFASVWRCVGARSRSEFTIETLPRLHKFILHLFKMLYLLFINCLFLRGTH